MEIPCAKSRIAFCIMAASLAAIVAILACGLALHERAGSFEPSPDAAEQVSDDGFPVVDWAYWQTVNPDVIGWVSVSDTPINYPIVQAPANDPTYYLTHDVYKAWNYMGCPYLDATCAEDGLLSRNSAIFGHNLGYGDDKLFATFALYSDFDYAAAHRTVQLQTPTWKQTLTVEGASVIAGWNSLKRTSFDSLSDFNQYHAMLITDADVRLAEPGQTRLYTFCTCSYNYWGNERTLVYAVPEKG